MDGIEFNKRRVEKFNSLGRNFGEMPLTVRFSPSWQWEELYLPGRLPILSTKSSRFDDFGITGLIFMAEFNLVGQIEKVAKIWPFYHTHLYCTCMYIHASIDHFAHPNEPADTGTC